MLLLNIFKVDHCIRWSLYIVLHYIFKVDHCIRWSLYIVLHYIFKVDHCIRWSLYMSYYTTSSLPLHVAQCPRSLHLYIHRYPAKSNYEAMGRLSRVISANSAWATCHVASRDPMLQAASMSSPIHRHYTYIC